MASPIRTGLVALGLVVGLSGCTISSCPTAERLGMVPAQPAPAMAPAAAAPAAAAAQASVPRGQASSDVFTFLPPSPHPNVNNWPGAHVGTRSGVSGE